MKKRAASAKAPGFSHMDESGAARMVDVGPKPAQRRVARAGGRLVCRPATLRLLRSRGLPKGDVLAVARIAGIQAAKRTAELVPLCHTLGLDCVSVDFRIRRDHIEIAAEAICRGWTGVEMEAMVAVSVAALTLYDMMKAVDRTMRIEDIRVLEKIKE